jgi:hypothetical protein
MLYTEVADVEQTDFMPANEQFGYQYGAEITGSSSNENACHEN